MLLRKGGAAAARLVGQLAISSLPTSTTVDLRPLAIGKGSFQFVFKITTGKQDQDGHQDPDGQDRLLDADRDHAPRLGQDRRHPHGQAQEAGKRWVAYATGAAKL